jgi:hypothetical protein
MKTKLVILSVVAMSLSTSYLKAQTFSDDFSSADTSSGLGSNYTEPSGNIFINSDSAYAQAAAGENVALYNGFDLSQNFTISLDVGSQSAGSFQGILFDYNPTTGDGLMLRISSGGPDSTDPAIWQFVTYDNGSVAFAGPTQQQGNFADYVSGGSGFPTATITLSSTSTPDEYSFYVTTTDGGTTLLGPTTLIGSTGAGVSGEAGFDLEPYSRGDNFSVTTAPEPSVVGLFALGFAGLLFRLRSRASSLI